MNSKSRSCACRHFVLIAISLLTPISLTAQSPDGETNPFERPSFANGWRVLGHDTFHSGASTIFELLPASRRLILLSSSQPKTRSGNGALVNEDGPREDFFSFASLFASPFVGSSSGIFAPNALAAAKIFESGQSWTTNGGINWNPDGVPASGDTLTLNNSVINIPTTMQIGTNLGALSVTFANNFNPTNTTTIGSNVSGSPIFTFDPGWSLTNNATSGSVTFNATASGGTTPLTFRLNGVGTVTVAAGGTTNWNTVIGDGTNPGSITKAGTGTLTLGGVNTYTGGTTINAGVLRVTNTSGSGTGMGTVTVSNAGTFLAGGTTTGGGGISGPVTVNAGATLSPGTAGNGAGTTAILRTGALTLASGSHLGIDLNGATLGTGYDQVAVAGLVDITAAVLNVTLGMGFSPTGQAFVIVSNDGIDSVVGLFSPTSTIPAGYVIDYFFNDSNGNLFGGNDIALVPIPEPGTWIGAALALAAIGVKQRRRLWPLPKRLLRECNAADKGLGCAPRFP